MRKVCRGTNGCFDVKPIDAFHRRSNSPDGYADICKACELERVQVDRHGLSAADKRLIAEEQGGCKICGRTEPGRKGWVVDHDRKCCPGDKSCIQCRRGILCQWCNTALGYAQDSPNLLRRMADYLESGDRLTQLNARLSGSLTARRVGLLSHTDGRDGRTEIGSSQRYES